MNEVRARADMSALAYSKENVLEERHREFMGEGIRYWDLLRQGVDYAAEAIAGTWTVKSGNVDDQIVISKENIVSKRGLCRIPQNQIVAANGVYTQNTGWN
ncbi:MAG: RagB/SusD family nutrient uptake outer membrane protein, partial [Alistipes sp.]|nr:RagB/SusD family nutrient uptake outer membrane protein [Alistipes sp.]